MNGYAEFHSLPEKQAEQIELFLAGLQVYWNLWATGGTHLYPALLPEYSERIARTAEFVERYARQKGCPIWAPLNTTSSRLELCFAPRNRLTQPLGG